MKKLLILFIITLSVTGCSIIEDKPNEPNVSNEPSISDTDTSKNSTSDTNITSDKDKDDEALDNNDSLTVSQVPNQSTTSNTDSTTNPPEKEEPKKSIAVIYTIDSNAEYILSQEIKVDKLNAIVLFEQLRDNKIIPINCTIHSFTIKDNIGILDCSKGLYEANVGSGTEGLMLDSIAMTYLENYNLDKFKILVDNKEYEGGHISLSADDYFTKDGISHQ